MNKILLVSLIIFLPFSSFNQTLGGYIIYDYLVNALHPFVCSPDYVTGMPNDSTWVNFNNNDVMTGNFGLQWTEGNGDELLLETSFNRANYMVRLLLSTNQYSSVYNVYEADWIQISDTAWHYLFIDCSVGMINAPRFILPLDFFSDFGLTTFDFVKGIEITFLQSGGAPDLAGVYIIAKPSILNPVNLGEDKTLCQGDILILDATTLNASYLWQDGSSNSTFTVIQQGLYWVKTTIDSCSSMDSINIIIEDCEIKLEIPNFFSPNNDGVNDVFVPSKIKGILSVNALIYNRWGNLVFTSDDLNIKWDGKTNNGDKVADGVYYWIVNFTDRNNNKSSKNGSITLLR
jgi:gliding motility-associated-like protein